MGRHSPLVPTKFPLVTAAVDVGDRAWQITAVQSQDALLATLERLENLETIDDFPYGLLLSEAAVGLARMLTTHPGLVAGKRVLELGAGVGVPGIVARALGAAVWQTDYQSSALLLAQQNAQQNGVTGIAQFLGDWRYWTHDARYDVILGADIMYDRPMYFYLEQIFNRCLVSDGRLLLSDPGRPQAMEFAAYLEKRGWHMDMETRTVSLAEQGQENRPVDVALWIAGRT